MSHTPTPWTSIENIYNTDLNGTFEIHDIGIKVPALCRYGHGGLDEAKANAAFIVQAVNSHEVLVEALDAIRRKSYEPDPALPALSTRVEIQLLAEAALKKVSE